MRIIPLIFVLAIACGFVSGQGVSKTYKDEVYPVSFSLPSTWGIEKSSDPRSRVVATSDGGRGLDILDLGVSNARGNERTPSSTMVKLFLEDRPDLLQSIADSLYRDARIHQKGKTYLGNQDAFFLVYGGEYRTTTERFLMRSYLVQTLFEGNVYAFTFTTSEDRFERMLPTFKEIASSVVFVPTRLR